MNILRSLAFGAVSASTLYGQVQLDTSVVLTGAPQERVVLNVASPTEATSAVIVTWAASGAAQWATASAQGQTLVLNTQLPAMTIRPGTLLRFKNPVGADQGPFAWSLQYADLGALPLERPDGISPYPGQLTPGLVSEVVYTGGSWVLLGRAERQCPPGFTQVDAHYCIGTNQVPAMPYHPAMDACAALGGRLCSWEEYYFACMHVGSQLTGMFDGWEWIDDTSNHGHTGDITGRYTCADLDDRALSNGAIQARCCYSLR